MKLWRRFTLLLCFAVWQGGFMFYGGVVVPVGGRVLGSETDQGFITQVVTNYLNAAGAVCLIMWCAVLWFDNRLQCRWPCRALLCCIASGLIALAALHRFMDRLLDAASHSISDETMFHNLHRMYLATSTAQWFACLLLLCMTLKLWQAADRAESHGHSASHL
jgi:hypothetical protein